MLTMTNLMLTMTNLMLTMTNLMLTMTNLMLTMTNLMLTQKKPLNRCLVGFFNANYDKFNAKAVLNMTNTIALSYLICILL
ncbi:MAG: Unknown protein [uncultured Campylobacterales bacterium]|uniref:Uncharacterized protein n=1 Tax=uncultured Campylobacterales bacterium TaxID=352960 RepID=A0A6S6T7N3_9BACT|nr:MAG: Unknown protein [uncultured Campylobacterales bacterium]